MYSSREDLTITVALAEKRERRVPREGKGKERERESGRRRKINTFFKVFDHDKIDVFVERGPHDHNDIGQPGVAWRYVDVIQVQQPHVHCVVVRLNK